MVVVDLVVTVQLGVVAVIYAVIDVMNVGTPGALIVMRLSGVMAGRPTGIASATRWLTQPHALTFR